MEVVKQLKLRIRAANGIMQTKSPSSDPLAPSGVLALSPTLLLI